MADPTSYLGILPRETDLTPPTTPSESTTAPRHADRLRSKTRLRLPRILSTPSLAPFARRRATSNPYTGRATLSCVSLTAGSQTRYGTPTSSQSPRADYFTASTSEAGPPVLGDNNHDDETGLWAVRKLDILPHTPPAGVSALPPEIQYLAATGRTARWQGQDEQDPILGAGVHQRRRRRIRDRGFDFWGDMPHELKLAILTHLSPRQLIQVSVVSRDFHKTCLDGQLWTSFDASDFYEDISADSLARILVAAGPFVKNLNLRGCLQVEHHEKAEAVVEACRNLVKATLEGCKNFQRSTLHNLVKTNSQLAQLNLTGLAVVTNRTCMIIARSCPQLECLNVSWCSNTDAHGIRSIILGCPRLRDLRASEIRGLDDLDLARDLFETNKLERLILSGCNDLTDRAFKTMLTGEDPEIDVLTNVPMVPLRKLRHLDLTRCTRLTSLGVSALAHLVPRLEGLRLSGCTALTDAAVAPILATTPFLTHLNLEEVANITNDLLSAHLARAPCATVLEELSFSYCEQISDVGVLPVIQACTSLKAIDIDNTRISDLVLLEACIMVRARSLVKLNEAESILSRQPGLHMVIYDCPNITWTGVREVLARNTTMIAHTAPASSRSLPTSASTKHDTLSKALTTQQPHLEANPISTTAQHRSLPQQIRLKCFYGYQQTVDEHGRRVRRGDPAGARRLEAMWAEYMMANEEAGLGGASWTGTRRRRRRAREARMMVADEEGGEVGILAPGAGRRRRARSGAACAVM